MTIRYSRAAAVCTLLVGCATGPRQGATPPAVAELFDEAQVMAIMAALRDSVDIKAPITYAVIATPDIGIGLAPMSRGLRSSATERLANRLIEVSTDKLRQYRGRLVVQVTLEDQGGLSARFGELRPARQVSAGNIGGELVPIVRGQPPNLGPVTVWVKVDETGRVTATRITGRSGNATYDQAVERTAASANYSPCTMDGVPISCWIERRIASRSRTL